ncbi:MAG TPA: preprotein translocase subunit SecE [Chitinophagales bacterium]|nr:preprotein translocase subunit SecE [Chitinophagales bacterium]
MNKITAYIEEAYDELMHKVTWPTWVELQESAVVVLVTAVYISVAVLIMDLVFKTGTAELYKIIIK